MIFPPTDWLDFAATEYDVGAPATSLSFERWFRNVVASMQGSAGAPRLAPEALGSITAGDVVQIGLAAEQSYTVAGDAQRIGISQPGNLRLKLNIRRAGGGGGPNTLTLNRLRGGSTTTLQTWTLTTTATDYSTDFAVEIKDQFFVSLAISGGGTNYIKDLAFCTGGERLWPGIFDPAFIWGVS